MAVAVEDRGITTGSDMSTMLPSRGTIIRPSHMPITLLVPRAIPRRLLPAIRTNLPLLLNGDTSTSAIMPKRRRQCQPLHILHIRLKATLRCITPNRSSRFHIHRLNTTPMARRRRRSHLSGMDRHKRIILVAGQHVAVIMTRAQGVQQDPQTAVAMHSPTSLVHALITPLNTFPTEGLLLQHRRLSPTIKTRNMGSTHVAVAEATEMAAIVHKNDSASHGKKKKRKTNTLGLTPGMGEESEDDEGEEKTLSELLGQEALSNIGDVAAFLAVRRQNYPTRARIEAKKAAAQAQRNEDKTASLEREADKLRKQLRKVESSIKRKREQGDEGDEMRGASDNSSDDGPPETLSTKASSTTIPSRPLLAATGKRADVTRHCKYYSTGGTCGKKGKCRFVHDPAIREAAIKEREANHGRLTIQQRLILNDKEQEDLTVLRSIQYLRQKGIMSDAIAASAAALNGSEEISGEKDTMVKKEASSADKDPGPPLVVSSTSPYQLLPPPASPPQATVKEEPDVSTAHSHSNDKMEVESDDSDTTKHYEGWLLQPYGSSGKGNVAP
ncbi:hypothetical protein G3M48_002934 [Beauveria asiatica]|uniref:C3H1-type domain-containing protein n=1 Tax=Beauveria asiatica TaxID=1069075 RepID=A0AAW0RWM7_9HYPO